MLKLNLPSRRVWFTIAILCIGACVSMVASGCSQRADGSNVGGLPPRPALINHVVFFKLVDPTDADALIADCDARLATIPGVSSYFCGKHIDTGRGTVDGEYDVGFFVGFDSLEDYAVYVDHPDHIAMVSEWRPKFEWILVRDVLDER